MIVFKCLHTDVILFSEFLLQVTCDMTYFDQSAFPKPNARYWSPLGTTILCVEHDLYKIDDALLASKLHTLTSLEIDGYQCHKFPESWEISSKDFELLLDHIEKSKYATSELIAQHRSKCDQTSRFLRCCSSSTRHLRSPRFTRCEFVCTKAAGIYIPDDTNTVLQV